MIDPEKQLPIEISTVNEQWFDALIRHQIFLLRMSGSVRNDILRLLNSTEKELANLIVTKFKSGINPRNIQRTEQLIAEIRRLRSTEWDKASALMTSAFKSLAVEEAAFLASALQAVMPVEISPALPPPELLKSLVTERPFEGQVLRSWARGMRNADLTRIEQAIRVGMVQGQSAKEIARNIVGTARAKGRDGILQMTRRNVEAITRTATIHFSNAARREFFLANSDVFDEELFVATLDSRTTPICRSLDGQRFPVGEGPQPPLHIACRSLRVASIAEEAIGMRPFKASTQKMLLREYTDANGLKRVASRAKLPHGTKVAFDRWARSRVRSLTGRIPAKVTYQKWLETQSREFQDDVLGKTRGKLFRDGGLTLDKFVNRAGDEIPLAELARREGAAFRAAGLDVDDFRRAA